MHGFQNQAPSCFIFKYKFFAMDMKKQISLFNPLHRRRSAKHPPPRQNTSVSRPPEKGHPFSFFVKTVTFLLLTVFLLPQCQKEEKQKEPNIVFIFADDMGYGDVSFNNPYARTSTPAIDKLITEGISFTDAHSAGSVCTPSRYGLLTGRYFFRTPPKQDHWGYLSPYIEPERETIGDLMKKSGYTTACIGKWHLGLNWKRKDTTLAQIPEPGKLGYTNTDFSLPVSGGPNESGFDYSFILPASLDMPPYVFLEDQKVIDTSIILTADVYPNRLDSTVYVWDDKYTNENDIYWGRGVWWRNGEMSESFRIENCLDKIVDKGISFIEREAKNEHPFFLYLPLTGPHTPWVPGPDFQGQTKLGTYGDFIAQIDHVVQRINTKLKEIGADKNTIIIFSSDNGGHWAEEDKQRYAHQSNWGARGQKGDAWEGGHHVPLVIKWPGRIKEGLIYDEIVSLTDFFATFAEMTGQKLKNNQAEDSFSFMSVLNGEIKPPVRDHVIYLSSARKLAIKKEKWKYIDCLGSGGFSQPSILQPLKNGPKGQLYNMKKDPLENNNLYLLEPEKVNELTKLLDETIKKGYSRARK
jgi:arylsulfatase A